MVEKRESYFSSNNAVHKVHVITWIPQDVEVRGILQIAHGMVEFIDRYDAFARHMCRQGFIVVGNDHLGHGKTVNNEDEWGYFADENGTEYLVKDMYKLMKITKREFKDLPYFLLGHSMGSFLTRNFIIRYGSELTGVIIMGTGNQPLWMVKLGLLLTRTIALFRGWKYRSKFINSMAFGSYNKGFQPARTEVDWLTRDEAIVDWYVNEPACTFTFTIKAYNDMFHGLEFIAQRENLEMMPKDLPVLFISGDHDPVGGNGKGVRQVCKRFKSIGMKDVSIILYKDGRHEILNEINRTDVYEDISKWLTRYFTERD